MGDPRAPTAPLPPSLPSPPRGAAVGQSLRGSRRRRELLSCARGSPAGAAWRPRHRAAGGGARAPGRRPRASSAVSAAVVAARAARRPEQRRAARSAELRAVLAISVSERARDGLDGPEQVATGCWSSAIWWLLVPRVGGAEGTPSRGVASGGLRSGPALRHRCCGLAVVIGGDIFGQ
jgi:hypothetical protein